MSSRQEPSQPVFAAPATCHQGKCRRSLHRCKEALKGPYYVSFVPLWLEELSPTLQQGHGMTGRAVLSCAATCRTALVALLAILSGPEAASRAATEAIARHLKASYARRQTREPSSTPPNTPGNGLRYLALAF